MSAYKFEDEHRGDEIAFYYDEDAIAIDMYPTDRSAMYGKLHKRDRPDLEVIIPVENAETLVKVLQDMITEIRARQTRAA